MHLNQRSGIILFLTLIIVLVISILEIELLGALSDASQLVYQDSQSAKRYYSNHH